MSRRFQQGVWTSVAVLVLLLCSHVCSRLLAECRPRRHRSTSKTRRPNPAEVRNLRRPKAKPLANLKAKPLANPAARLAPKY